MCSCGLPDEQHDESEQECALDNCPCKELDLE